MKTSRIFWFSFPLVLSWMLMLAEGPWVQAAIARLSEAELALAAFGVVVAIQVTIESPIINLLATSTALTASAQAYNVLWRFMIHINVALTVVAVIFAYTPLYDWLMVAVMGIPLDVSDAARPAMKIMTLWTAAIGWRRFNQGILIRFGKTRLVGWGSAIRLVASGGVAIGLAVHGEIPGVEVGAWALMAGVVLEAFVIAAAVRPTIREHLREPSADASALSYGDVVRYHAPLAATAVLALLVQPIIQAGLARMDSPHFTLAAWPIAFNIILFFRSIGFALPEVLIALIRTKRDLAPLRRFTMALAVGVTVLVLGFAFTPLFDRYLTVVADLSPELQAYVVPGVIAGCLLPALHLGQSWYRGLMMCVKQTVDVYWGMGIFLILVCVGVVIGVAIGGSGITTAFIVMLVASIGEMFFLGVRARRAIEAIPDSE